VIPVASSKKNHEAIGLVRDFLRVDSPDEWFQAAPDHLPELLMDHANCEKKAASTALSMMYRYVQFPDLLKKMSSLAREELRHFEQVLELMAEQGVVYEQINSARYAQGLHQLVSKNEPRRLVDLLICGAVVEARSCERFAGLASVLPEDIGALYGSLLNSEARHFQDYLQMARRANEQAGGYEDFAARVEEFLVVDAQLVTSDDDQFRFHSGKPAV
jgi:tRNA-(ms[2]io[6]A)-hydroxylase